MTRGAGWTARCLQPPALVAALALALLGACRATGCFATNATAQIQAQEGEVDLVLWPLLPQTDECASFPSTFSARLSLGDIQLFASVRGFNASQRSTISLPCSSAVASDGTTPLDLSECRRLLREAVSGSYTLDGQASGSALVFTDPVQAVELRNFDYSECWQNPTLVYSLSPGNEFVGISVTPANCDLPRDAFSQLIVRLIYVAPVSERASLGAGNGQRIRELGAYRAADDSSYTSSANYDYKKVKMFGIDAAENPGKAADVLDFLQPFLACYKGTITLTLVSRFCGGKSCDGSSSSSGSSGPSDPSYPLDSYTSFFATAVVSSFDTKTYRNCFEKGWLGISLTRLSIHYSVTDGVKCFEPLTAATHSFTLVVSYGSSDEVSVSFTREVGEFDFRSGATSIYPEGDLDDSRLLRLFTALSTGNVVLRARLYCRIGDKYGAYLDEIAINLPTVRMDRYKRISYAIKGSAVLVQPVAFVAEVPGDVPGPLHLQVIFYQNEGTDDVSLSITELGRFALEVDAVPVSSFTLPCSSFQGVGEQPAQCADTLSAIREFAKTKHAIARFVIAENGIDVMDDSVYNAASISTIVVCGVCAVVVLVAGLAYLLVEIRKHKRSAYGSQMVRDSEGVSETGATGEGGEICEMDGAGWKRVPEGDGWGGDAWRAEGAAPAADAAESARPVESAGSADRASPMDPSQPAEPARRGRRKRTYLRGHTDNLSPDQIPQF